LANDFATAPIGSVIIAVVKEDGAKSLSKVAQDVFVGMGAKKINTLANNQGYLFMGIKGTRSHLEKMEGSVNGGMILGYSKVTKREKVTRTKTINQSVSYKKTINRVYKKVVKETVGGVTRTRTVTRVMKRVITCRKTRKITKRVT